jgi:3-phenylpropionate/cinnamic acid dioxygenase small subunit
VGAADGPNVSASLLAAGSELLYREMMLIDEKRWDEWLALYAPDCEFWMPMWGSEEELNDDPNSSLSHMYYRSREGLADRIVRIRSRRSPASTPAARTTHLAGNILLLEPPTDARMKLRAAWTCHVYSTRMKDQHVFFGHSEYELARPGAGGWIIARKKVVLQNDQIPTMLDIYCI